MDVRLTAEDGYQAQRSYSIASAPEDEHLVLTVERLQSITIGFVTALVIAGLVVVAFLERPYGEGSGSIRPTEMRKTLELIDNGSAAPCDERGVPRPV